MGSFIPTNKNQYILVAATFPTNDTRVVIKFLKNNFTRFGTPRAFTHFYNKIVETLLVKYGIKHITATTYHP